jgi:outer membrane immunogenic protein
MKRVAIALLAGVATVAGLGYSASAAELAVKAAPPPAPPPPSWTGFYIGGHGGAAWQSTPNWTLSDPNGVLATVNVDRAGNAGLGGVGGIHAGYNWQFAPAWVVGVEGDFSWASLSDHRTTGPLTTVAGVPFLNPSSSLSMNANTEWLASARARLGVIWPNNMMWYATGGGAWVNANYSATALFPVVTAPGLNSVTSFNSTKSGWVAGGGAEWMATPNILLRAEYLFYQIDNSAASSAGTSPRVVGLPLPLNYNWDKYNIQVFRVGGEYKF